MLRRSFLTQMLLIGTGLTGLTAGTTTRARGQDQPATSQPAPVPSTTAIRFSLDHPVDGTSAPFFLALADGYFRDAGLSVTIDVAKGTDDAIARVASGSSDIALADINALIRFRDTANGSAVKAVFVMFNRAPYAIVARKSRGIRALADIEGKTIGVAEGDLGIRLWPALAEQNGIKPGAVKLQRIGAAVREPMLSAGQVDAVTGSSYLSALNLRDRGIPADDIAVLRFADYGSSAYGAALIVNPSFAGSKPEAVRGFVRAVLQGLRKTIDDPSKAIDAVMTHINGGSRELELERLRTALNDNIITAEVRHNGFGGIDPARLSKSIDDIGLDYKFRQKPTAADIFDPAFLPPAEERQLR